MGQFEGESKRYQEHQPGQYTAATNILPLLRHLLDDVDNDVFGDHDHDAIYEFLVLIMLVIMKIRVKCQQIQRYKYLDHDDIETDINFKDDAFFGAKNIKCQNMSPSLSDPSCICQTSERVAKCSTSDYLA